MPTSLLDSVNVLAAGIIECRRQLHARPELGGQEEHTAAFVAGRLRAMGLQPRERLGGTYGLCADILPDGAGARGSRAGVGLRADMDGLPVCEETGLEFASQQPGVMHACGHDAHMAMLLGAGQLLLDRRSELPHPVRLIFQPSEECPPGGAADLIAAGVLEGLGRVFGLHIWSDMQVGTLGTRVGAFMSGVTELAITVRGRGGHAAMPQQCVDPIVVAAELITALQTVVSRSVGMADAGVVSVTRVQAGTATNVIPPTAELRGTVRALAEPVQATILRRIRELAAGIAQAHGATAEVVLSAGYPPLVNDGECVARVLEAARVLGLREDQLLSLAPQGGAEDFALYARAVPAAFAFLGARNEEKGAAFPHHHPRFDIDEAALPLGAALLAQLALQP